MSKFIKISITPLVVSVIAAILVFVDSLIAPLFLVGASFTWMAFINWTVFFSSTFTERLKAIIGYIIGYISANAILIIGNYLSNMVILKQMNIPIASIIAVFIINFLVMYFDRAKKLFMDSIPGIFVGISLTFSGAGEHFVASNIQLLVIIMVYGILGLLCGLGTDFFVQKINSKLNTKNETN